jgi:hypothetical protein
MSFTHNSNKHDPIDVSSNDTDGGAEGKGEISVPSAQCCCEPKTALLKTHLSPLTG